MTGRGIDQILSCPGDPQLHEAYVRDARQYVRLAEMAHGPIPRAVKPAYIWGDALAELDRGLTDVRIINLETSITCSDGYWQGKGIHYRMHPRNIDCLTAARIDCCCLANNHILDWGYDGLAETIRTLDQAGIAHAGAGRDAAQAEAPAVLDVPGNGRVLVVSLGLASSGIPQEWEAARSRAGVNLLGDLTEKTACRIASGIAGFTKPGDVTVVSIHWGANWGYEISDEERDFAGMLVEQGIDAIALGEFAERQAERAGNDFEFCEFQSFRVFAHRCRTHGAAEIGLFLQRFLIGGGGCPPLFRASAGAAVRSDRLRAGGPVDAPRFVRHAEFQRLGKTLGGGTQALKFLRIVHGHSSHHVKPIEMHGSGALG